ncbi:DNA methyltransferase [Plesiomonas shigelloides]|uniref:DNA methyltransferase n=2 Tax=Enterobacteriaceae TaxID=543 RepID=UPI0028889BBA|nr:DNA methyltransferase [Plesiomonas shigelloides]MDT1011170.1 DNA methyltransferase [Plesiomonas shigelloides]
MQQDSLFFSDSPEQDQIAGPVTCLSKIFANDQARRDYFLALLAEKLKDPEFRKIEGFPIGSDEDILNLSDPPYYTACPNPWIGDFVAEWEAQKSSSDEEYHREPFAADVSEGKNDPIYNAHSYHTKVPHKAIMRYILHYTNPGDIVFDGFCGTGMTGVAAQMCGDRETVASLGYQVKADGTILQEEVDESGKTVWKPFSKLGARKAVLNDLSPAATFIAYNYNTPVDVEAFEKEAKRIIAEVQKECGWMFETQHPKGGNGKINYTVWSDAYSCPYCANEFLYAEEAFDYRKNDVQFTPDFNCPHCNGFVSKNPSKDSGAEKPERIIISDFDPVVKNVASITKQVPFKINYSIGTTRHEKIVDEYDINIINKAVLKDEDVVYIPLSEIIEGDKSGDPFAFGVKFVHQFYTKRILKFLALLNQKIHVSKFKEQLSFVVGSMLPKLTIMNRYMPQHGGRALVGPMANTLYVPPVSVENNPIDQFEFQLKKIVQALNNKSGSIISNQGIQSVGVKSESIDYIFIDPPFGANIMYSELNYIRESWLRVFTNNKPEAIENKTQKKDGDTYRQLMCDSFKLAYSSLKPGRWITVEFSNTKASVWNSIQNALSDAGFIVATVTMLDTARGGLHAMLGPTAVKNPLVITAYKPNGGFEARFETEAITEEGVWDFIRTHLKYLPVTKIQDNSIQMISERDPRILFDQLVAYYVRKGYQLPIDSKEFQMGLAQRFSERDGMFFLPEQVAEYDKKKLSSGELMQTSLFVKDEASAIDWLRQLLKNKPQTFADINPLYMQQLSGFSKHEVMLDLRELLSQNFLYYDGQDEVPDQIHSYLSSNWKELRNLAKNDSALVAKAKDRWYVPDPNKAGDLEKLREKSLLKEFEEYKGAKKKLKVFRIEAVRAGFKKLWAQQEFTALISVAEKLPNKVLEEDPVLLMYYDQAVTLSQIDADDEW